MKITIHILLSVLGLIAFTNAQGITNTLGGDNSTDKFIVENSNAETGLVVTGDGKVGVGLTDPFHNFTVYEEAQTRIAVQSEYSGTGYSDGLQFIHGQGTNGQSWIINYEDHHLHIGTNGNNDITIEDGGQIGIQTTSPGANLDVNGDVILGESGTRFMEIQEITGTTSSTLWNITVSYPSGWNKDNTRVLSCEIQNDSGAWYGVSDAYKIYGYIINTGNITISYGEGFKNNPYRIIAMKMP